MMAPDEASNDTLTEVFYQRLRQFSAEYACVHGYLAVVVCLFGVIANTANILVLTRPNMLTCTNRILTWLAVADLLTMLSYLPVSVHFYIYRDTTLSFPATPSLGWISFLLFQINITVVSHTIAIWLTISLAIFRCLCICYPTTGARMCTVRRANLTVLGICLSTAAVCIPNYLVTGIKTTHLSDDESPTAAHAQAQARTPFPAADEKPSDVRYVVSLIDSPLDALNYVTPITYDVSPAGVAAALFVTPVTYAAPLTRVYYELEELPQMFLSQLNMWVQTFLVKLVPCVVLTILTLVLVFAMYRVSQRHAMLRSHGRHMESFRAQEHNRTSAMLLAVVSLFLLTELPQGILTLCSIFNPEFFDRVYWPLGDLLDMMALINNSINFVLYCSMSRQFRETFVRTTVDCCDVLARFCCCCWCCRFNGIAKMAGKPTAV